MTRRRLGRPTSRRLPDRWASAAVVAALVGLNVVERLLSPPWWLGPIEAAGLLVVARMIGLTGAQLGLSRPQLWPGCRWGLGAAATVTSVYLVGVLLPETRAAFQDSRYDLPVPEALFAAFVTIPLGTVLPEEIAFRSVLWGALSRHSRPWQVLGTTSVLFGLWHAIPSSHLATGNRGVSEAVGTGPLLVAATVAVTALGGLVFGELRRRSGTVLASGLAHWATNALGVLFGMLARNLEG